MRRFDMNSFFEKIKNSFSKKQFGDKSFKFGGYSVFSGIIVVCIAIFAILAVESISSKYTKIDLTSNKLYSISEETENIVKSLDKDVNIYFIAQSGKEDQLIQNILEKYGDLSDKLNVIVKDPATNPNFASKYTSSQVSSNSIIVECGEKSKYIGYDELYETEYDSSYNQTNNFVGESSITSAINYVSGDNFPKIYQTTGHGETELSESASKAVNKSNIEVEDISLLTAGSIPEDAACVMIYEPNTDISENEKNLLLDYLKNGGNLIVYTGYTGEELPNLNALMENYGVKSENAIVFEGDSTKYYGYNYYLVPNIESHDITDPLIESKYPVLVPMARPIKITDDESGSYKITQILTTSRNAYKKTNVDGTLEKEDGDEEGQFTVGVAITDTTDNGDAHIVWITSGQMLNDQINAYVSGGNQDLFLNALNWMSDREESIAIHPKTISQEYLQVSSFASTFWSMILIFIIPVIILALGIYIWIRRKSR